MNLDITPGTEARLTAEAQRNGITVEALLERLMNERTPGPAAEPASGAELPLLHLGPMDALHRRDIYDDER